MGKMGRLSAKTGMAKVTSDYEEVDLLNECITDGDTIPDGLKYVQPLSGRGSSRGVVAGRGRGRSGGRRGRPVASQPRLDQCPVHSVPDYLSHQQPNQKRKSDAFMSVCFYVLSVTLTIISAWVKRSWQ